MAINELDREKLRREFASAKPFPYIVIDDFLQERFAVEVALTYPQSFDSALSEGISFNAFNEKKKVQITDSSRFPAPIAVLNDAISSPQFLADLSDITGIPKLVADPKLIGGGMHITGPGGRLDVHLDFNYLEEQRLHRRLNILIYLNEVWEKAWGGEIELWDKDVKQCHVSLSPVFNRCVIFETSDISYHGVVPISPGAVSTRKSFAAYYYTREAPPHWKGIAHSTIFKTRPEETMRALAHMPVQALTAATATLRQIKSSLKDLLGR